VSERASPAALGRLEAGGTVVGIVQSFPSPQITELAVWSGFDFVILDCEHGTADEAAHLACLAAAHGHDLFVAIRIRRGDLAAVGRYADWGADAILMPDVTRAEEARAFVSAALPGPDGTRSSASLTRATRYRMAPAGPKRPLLLAMIESATGVEQVEAIAAAGVDGLVVGPSDLSADLGLPGRFDDDRYRAAFEQVERAAHAHCLILGSRPHPPFDLDRLLGAGHRFVLATSDVAVLAGGLRSALAAVARTTAP